MHTCVGTCVHACTVYILYCEINLSLNCVVCRSAKSPVTVKRINNIIEYLTFAVFKYTARGLYESDKFMFTLLLTLKIDMQNSKVKHQEFQTLIKGYSQLPCPMSYFRFLLSDVTFICLVSFFLCPISLFPFFLSGVLLLVFHVPFPISFVRCPISCAPCPMFLCSIITQHVTTMLLFAH